MNVRYLTDHHHLLYRKKTLVPASGGGREYGSRIATTWMIKTSPMGRILRPGGARWRMPWRRVYAIHWSNTATLYVNIGGGPFYLRDFDLSSED
jgi:hypothetical protein